MKAVFLDRDGTINVDGKGYISKIEDFELYPFAAEAIKILNEAGFLVFVVTNQSGVARGYYTFSDLDKLHSKLNNTLAEIGARIDDILDITQDEATLGKPALHDFKEGKTTLPYIYLYEALDDEGRQKLISLHGKTLKSDELSWLKEQFEKHNIVTKAYNEAKALVVEAIELMNKQGESNLSKIATSMIDREF